jgi:hypothetical protein
MVQKATVKALGRPMSFSANERQLNELIRFALMCMADPTWRKEFAIRRPL